MINCYAQEAGLKSRSRNVLSREKHHWWPKSLSKHWINVHGHVNRIDCSGNLVSSNPKEFGQISDGHNMLLSKTSVWNSTVEGFFDIPDGAMSSIVDMLKKLCTSNNSCISSEIENDSDKLNLLRECLISLLIRSPLYRYNITQNLYKYRSHIDKREARTLIAGNINQKYHSLINNSKNSGRFVVLFSSEKEFVYGDGLYSTLSASADRLGNFKTVIPITPNIAVVWSIPRYCSSLPKIRALSVSDDVVTVINNATQTYSKEYLFYRNEAPTLIEEFTCNQHLMYDDHEDPIFQLVCDLIQENDLLGNYK